MGGLDSQGKKGAFDYWFTSRTGVKAADLRLKTAGVS